MDSSSDINATDDLVEPELLDPTVNEADEELQTSTDDPDFYRDHSGDMGEDMNSNEGEEFNTDGDEGESSQPRTPRADEISGSQDEPLTPSLAPISWRDAAESKHTPTKDPIMPSFMDESMIVQVEINAKQSASNLVVLVHHLRTQLANISSLSVQYMSLHKTAIEGVSEHVHDGIASAQKLILKAQSLNTELKKVYKVQQDIKDTKKMLGQLEKLVDKMTKA